MSKHEFWKTSVATFGEVRGGPGGNPLKKNITSDLEITPLVFAPPENREVSQGYGLIVFILSVVQTYPA